MNTRKLRYVITDTEGTVIDGGEIEIEFSLDSNRVRREVLGGIEAEVNWNRLVNVLEAS